MSTLLEIRGLYGGYQDGVNILQGINLTVTQGEAVGIIGLNGSGKSTLGKAIINQIPCRRGRIFFDGQSIESKNTRELAQLGIALMHQGGMVFPNLSVWQNLQLAAQPIGSHSASQTWSLRASRIINSQLQEVIPLLQQPKKILFRTMADKLSGGQRQELALAMTLARSPKLVILDEPSAGLSPKAVEDTFAMLSKIRKQFGVSIMLIEQNILRAIKFCDRCVMLNIGTIQKEFKKNAEIAEIDRILFNEIIL